MKKIAVGSVVIILLFLLVRFIFYVATDFLFGTYIDRGLVLVTSLLIYSIFPIVVLLAAASKLGEIILAKLNPNPGAKT